MTIPEPEMAARFVGLVTLTIGGALTLAPRRVGALMQLGDHPRTARGVGLADLALAPGLLAGRPRWPWMVGRAALNLLIAERYLAVARAPRAPAGARAGAAALAALTVADGVVAARLHAQET